MTFNWLGIAAGAVLLCAPATASAAVLDVFGDTTNAPTFNRPFQNGAPPTSIDPRDFRYQAFTFSVSQTGQYTGRVTSIAPFGWDNVLGLYQTAFDPSQPLANVLLYKDDTIGLDAQFDTILAAGTTYIAVVTGFRPDSFGTYRLTFEGSGVVIENPGVPEPATWALMIGGFGLAGAALRRRAPRMAYA